MRRSCCMGIFACLTLFVVIDSAHGQAYPRYPYDHQPGNAGIMGIGPGGREAYHPDYYSGAPYRRYGVYGGYGGYGYGFGGQGSGPANYSPNVTGLPSQPMASPDALSTGGYRLRYYTANASHPNAAAVDVKVPAEARLWFQGQPTRQQGVERFFESPPLEPGKTYAYQVKAVWTDDKGKKIERTRTVQIRAGTHIALDLRKPQS